MLLAIERSLDLTGIDPLEVRDKDFCQKRSIPHLEAEVKLLPVNYPDGINIQSIIGAEMLLKDSRQAEQVECPGKFSMNKVRIDVQRRFSLLVDRGHQQRIHPQNLLVRIKRRIVNGQPAIQISRIGVVKVD